jgi:hypothetical protein
LRDIAESDLRASAPERLPKEPKPPEDGFDALDDEDEDEDEDEDDLDEDDDERCDENPLLKDDDELDGLASAGFDASGRIRDSASATCAYFDMVFDMVRWAGES